MHGAGVVGDYLYVLGGNTLPDNWENSVLKAPINPDGSLGRWSATTPMPQIRGLLPQHLGTHLVPGRAIHSAFIPAANGGADWDR